MDTTASRNHDMDAMTERATFAAVLVTLVRQRCAEAGTPRTSRTGLQMRVPVHERPAVRRGFDALIDHGILAMSGEDIGLTTQGRVFSAYCRRMRGERLHGADDAREPELLQRQLAAIQADTRLDADQSLDDVRSLPGRLEGPQRARRQRGPIVWIVLALIIAIVGVLLLARPPT